MANKQLTMQLLCKEATIFAEIESKHDDPCLYGITDGKAVGTYFEHKFQDYLSTKYKYERGSSAKGKDFPELNVDMKVTSVKQPQSSCPYRSARQKIYGLGYSLLVFVYEKTDNTKKQTSRLNILHAVFIEANRTADFQTTTGILQILKNKGNKDDIIAFMGDRLLTVEEIQANEIAEEILNNPPEVGYLTISNALQWRLQYSRVIEQAGKVSGIEKIK